MSREPSKLFNPEGIKTVRAEKAVVESNKGEKWFHIKRCFVFPGQAVVVGVTMYVLSISSLSEVEMVFLPSNPILLITQIILV